MGIYIILSFLKKSKPRFYPDINMQKLHDVQRVYRGCTDGVQRVYRGCTEGVQFLDLKPASAIYSNSSKHTSHSLGIFSLLHRP